ncbi:MAG: phosphohydrolase [Duncaniella sp.]|nr:phosphohydrolase [Duncaniella sp.]
MTDNMIDLCLDIAVRAHRDQKDLDGNPVILHPLTVGLKGKNAHEICAGFLHDVVEDTDITFDDLLAEGVAPDIVDALRLLTHDKGVEYLDYVRRIAASGNKLAIAVKLNDLSHNLERGRRMGYTRLVAKHESALREFEKILSPQSCR